MSQMEADAKNMLISLMEGSETVVNLTSEQRLLLARWAAKTAYMLNYAANYPNYVPLTHLHFLYTNDSSLPDRVVVFAQQHHGKSKFYWIQGDVWNATNIPASLQEEKIEQLKNDFYKIGLQLGKLLLLIASRPNDNWLFNMWRGIHVPLWPYQGKICWYEKDSFNWKDSYEALMNFHAGLGIVFFDSN